MRKCAGPYQTGAPSLPLTRGLRRGARGRLLHSPAVAEFRSWQIGIAPAIHRHAFDNRIGVPNGCTSTVFCGIAHAEA
jgi:hypothetical protein